MSLLHSLQRHAAQNGLNLFGLVDARRFDGCQPREQRSGVVQSGCGTIVVLGTAGRALHGRVPAGLGSVGDVGDAMALAATTSLMRDLAQRGHMAKMVDARWPKLNFDQLAEAAGFGIVSPVSGLLLHPEFGPWVRVRAALLLPGQPFGPVADASITDRFRPCCTCLKPCVAACPSAVHDGEGHTDRGRCADHRHKGGCEAGCDSRMACPIGAEHADAEGVPLHSHSLARSTTQRWFGLGVWRVVPRIFRGGPRD